MGTRDVIRILSIERFEDIISLKYTPIFRVEAVSEVYDYYYNSLLQTLSSDKVYKDQEMWAFGIMHKKLTYVVIYHDNRYFIWPEATARIHLKYMSDQPMSAEEESLFLRKIQD